MNGMYIQYHFRSSHGSDDMVVGFTPTCGISASHYYICEFEYGPCWCVLDTTLCDKVCQWLSPGTPVSSTNETDHHNIADILLKVALTAITQPIMWYYQYRRTEVCGNSADQDTTKLWCSTKFELLKREKQNKTKYSKWCCTPNTLSKLYLHSSF